MTDARKFGVFTCDRGHRVYDADLESTATLASVIQEIVENGFWRELARVPIDVIVRVLPLLDVETNTRRLLEIWIEERPDPRPAA